MKKVLKKASFISFILAILNVIYSKPSVAQSNTKFSLKDISSLKASFIPFSDSIFISNDAINQLERVYKIANEKDIVAIGEVTHGTSEILKFQKLISQKLIEKSGYECIILGETSLVDSYQVLDFVLNDRGNLKDISSKFVGMSDISDLLKFVAEFNTKRDFKTKVWVIGSDISDPNEVIEFIEQHVQNNKIENVAIIIKNLKRALSKYKSNKAQDIDFITENTKNLIRLLNNSNTTGADSLNLKVDFMIQSLTMMLNMLPNLNNTQLNYEARDSRIFENILWIHKYKPKLAIIKAHNYHINKKTIATKIFNSSKTFGELLSNKFGNKYYSIGTEIQKGSYFTGVSENLQIIEDSAKIGTFIGNNINHNLGIIYLEDSVRKIFNDKELKMTYGTAKSTVVDCKGLINDSFDALIFIKHSTPYKFYNNADFFTLFINLDTKLRKKLIKERNIYIKTDYLFKENDANVKFCYSIYFNDIDKAILKNYDSCIETFERGKALIFEIPNKAFYISIGIQVKKADWFKLQSVQINAKNIKLKDISFHDWNDYSYKFSYDKKSIVVYK